MFQQLYTAHLIHLYLQGKSFLPPCRFLSVIRFTRFIRKLLLLVSDGSSQFRAHPCDAEGWGNHPTKYTLQPGWNQPRRYPFLSHTAYPPHATYFSGGPVHPPLRGCICIPAIQPGTRTEQDDDHFTRVPSGQRAQEDYQRLCGTRGSLSRLPPLQPQPDQRLHPRHRCQPPCSARCP